MLFRVLFLRGGLYVAFTRFKERKRLRQAGLNAPIRGGPAASISACVDHVPWLFDTFL